MRRRILPYNPSPYVALAFACTGWWPTAKQTCCFAAEAHPVISPDPYVALAVHLAGCTNQKTKCLFILLQQHILPYSPIPYVALALRLHRLVANDINPWAFFKLVDKTSYRLALWLQFLFPKMRFLYLTRLVSAAGEFH